LRFPESVACGVAKENACGDQERRRKY